MPTYLKLDSTGSVNDGTVISSVSGVPYENIKQFQSVEASVLAGLDPDNFPSSSLHMPPIYRPEALAWGPTYGQSVLIDTTPPESSIKKRRFYSMNTNQVYASDWRYDDHNKLTGSTRVGSVAIPTYWTSLGSSPNLTPTGSTVTAHHRTRQGMSYLSSSSGEKLVMPLGDMGDRGLAVLDLTSDFTSSTWHAYEANLRNSFGYIPSPQQSQWVNASISEKYILVSQYQSGIAFYSTSSYEWLGNLQLPGWQTVNLIVRHAMVRKINNRNILSVAVAANAFSSSVTTNPVPKVLFYDVDAVDPADLSQTLSYNVTPSNTAMPTAVVFGSGSLSGSSNTRPLVTLQSDINTLPNSEVTLINESTTERALAVITTEYWAEIYDVTHLVIANTTTSESDNPAAATGSYGELVSGDVSYNGLNVAAAVPVIKSWLDTFAISSNKNGDCGPPANARARADWGNLMRLAAGGTCALAGPYILIGDITANYNCKAGYNLLSIEADNAYLSHFKVNRCGQYTTQLGITSQFELTPGSNLTFDSLGVSNSGSWIAGTVRGGVGVYAAQLPPEAKLSAINLALHESGSTTFSAGKAWEPTASGNPLGPECDRSYFSSSAYRYPVRVQGTSFMYNVVKSVGHQILYSDMHSSRWQCTSSWFDPAQRSGHQYKSFIINQNSSIAWNAWYPSRYPSQAAPTYDEFNTHGGFEILSLDILPDKNSNSANDVLFGGCRATNSVYAFVASPGGNNKLIDRTDWTFSPQGVAVASSSLPNKSLVAIVGGQSIVEFAYWDESAREFSSSVAPSSDFIRYPACYPVLPELASAPTPGSFRECTGIKAPMMVSGSLVTASAVTHIWAPYSMSGQTDNTDPGTFEILIVPITEVEGSSPDDKGFIECTASLNRFKRDTATGTGSVVYVGRDYETSTLGRLELWGSVQSHKYVLSWANEYDSLNDELVAHYVAVHELTMSQDTGTAPVASEESFVRNDITNWTNQGEPTADILMAKPIRLIPLTDYHLRDDGEGGKVTLSPQEDYLCVGGGSEPGMFLLYMGGDGIDLSSSAGYPVPVAGLTLATSPAGSGSLPGNSRWRGWRKTTGSFGGNISDQLSGAVYNDRTAKAPTWPLVDSTGTNFGIPSYPPAVGTVANPGQIYFRSNYMNVCEFKEVGNNLYIYAQTTPWTLWRVDKTAAAGYATSGATGSDATEVLELVGAVSDEQTNLRARCAVRSGPYIFWAGDIGAWVT